ncbi:hypothetical protein C0214_06770 [Methylobacterium sp. DM1]|uniref:Uncharacterized protein n=2 Tax=Methylorubrum extorquens TaxID=408 RepID=C5B3T1_METEA|nr:Hypothetical protein MexAM1_META2p0205 [Methylorubrum extorquens AM1]AWI88008.1 hypothetical protein C0214_06770 [Methylobacterium sp. DM1]CAX22875.1 protein of unknown function [Methylorubrum extorquens DM4]
MTCVSARVAPAAATKPPYLPAAWLLLEIPKYLRSHGLSDREADGHPYMAFLASTWDTSGSCSQCTRASCRCSSRSCRDCSGA